jgi:hypothetical protein
LTPERVLRELRRHNFAVLSTVDEDGNPDSAGVNYGVSRAGSDLALYVMTRRHLRKVRNIESNSSVALVVPLTRRVFWLLSPPSMQLHGRAEILDWRDEAGIAVFQRFWIGRRILDAYAASRERGETRVCFLKITLDPEIRTYMAGTKIWDLARHMEAGGATVHVG